MQRLKLITSICLLIILIACAGKNPDCKKFKNGTFTLQSELTGTHFLIVRNDSFQIETEKETEKITEWTVNWKNDCNYSLTLKKDNFGLFNSLNLPLSFDYEIIQTSKDYYIFKTTFDKGKSYATDTIWKVKP